MGKPCEHFTSVPDCRVCWLAENDIRYQRAWGLVPFQAAEKAGKPVGNGCIHLGEPTGETVECPTCGGSVKVKLFGCGKFGQCTLVKNVPGIACCEGSRGMGNARVPCPGFEKRQVDVKAKRWAYGVTTVPDRRKDLLPRTLASLKAAGFDTPRLFVDGDNDAASWQREFGCEVTARYPKIRTYGNWVLSMAELYIREPNAERYAIFQDDFVTYPNLRTYLDSCHFPEAGYWNLYTFRDNETIINGKPVGWIEAALLNSGHTYSGKMQQAGRGAVALVFSRAGVLNLLTHQHMVERPMDAGSGHKRVDGGIVNSMNKAGWREWVHNPSLTQHTGEVSSMGNRPHRQALSFRGESWDALKFLS